MGYDVSLYSAFERDEKGIRHGSGERLASASCSAFTPRRQSLAYGVDFTDLLVHGDGMIGDPEIENQHEDDARGVWTPDWAASAIKLKRLEEGATAANDEYTLSRLPGWRAVVEAGLANPEAVVSWSF
jgi:hypothetical protein